MWNRNQCCSHCDIKLEKKDPGFRLPDSDLPLCKKCTLKMKKEYASGKGDVFFNGKFYKFNNKKRISNAKKTKKAE